MQLDNIDTGKWFALRHRFKVCTGVRYIRGFNGDNAFRREWPKVRTNIWERNICKISETLGKYPQEIYAAVVCEIQSEWIFSQRVTRNMGDSFSGIEKLTQETFFT